MNRIKKMMMKRKLKKNFEGLQTKVKRNYKDLSKDFSKRMAALGMPSKLAR